MIYIPRFQKRKRLDTRGGMSPNVPVVTPTSAIYASSLSNILDKVSTNLAPAIAGYMAQEKKENDHTQTLNFNSDLTEIMGKKPADAGPNWFAENVAPLYEDRIKDIDDDNLKAKMRFTFTEKKAAFEADYVKKVHPELFKQRTLNGNREFTDAVKNIDLTTDQGKKQLNMFINNLHEHATQTMMWDYSQRTGQQATKEIVDNPEYKKYLSEIDNTITDAIKNSVKDQVQTLARKTDTPVDQLVKEMDSWAGGKALKKDSKFSFLDILDDASVDKKTFITELNNSIIEGERQQNTIEGLVARQEKESMRKEQDQIMIEMSEIAATDANNNITSAYEENKFSKLQDKIKSFLKTYPEAHKFKSLKTALAPNAYNNLRDKYLKGIDTRSKLDSFKHATDLLNEGKINMTDSSGIMDQLEENGVKEDHIVGATNFLQKLHSTRNKKEIAKISAFVSNLKSTLISLDQSDTFGSTTSGGLNLSSPDDAEAHLNQGLFFKNKNKSFTRKRKKTRYEMVLYQAEKGFNALVNRLVSGELSNNPKDDNYIGKEINNVYYHDVYVPLKEILKKDMHKHIVPQLNSSGSYKNLKNLMKGFNSPLFDARDSDDKDEHLTNLYYYVGEHFTNLKNKASKSKRVTSETLNKTRSILTTISLMKKLPEDIIDATKQIASIRTDVSLDPAKNVAENKRRNK